MLASTILSARPGQAHSLKGPQMEMFARDDHVAQWETALLPLRGAARLPALVALAWHVRQRDSARAAALAAEALDLLPRAALAAPQRRAAAARLLLVQAETIWLHGALDDAEARAREAGAALRELGDGAGCADAHWLQAWIAVDRGEHARCDAELLQAADAARGAGDTLRAAIAEAATARWAVLRDMHAASARWGHHFDSDEARPAALAAWVNDYLGLSASQSRDLGAAAGYYIGCYEAALATGQLRQAITAAINIGGYFTRLNDHHAALEWKQCALDLARPTGWPRSVGAGLMHTAESLRRLGRLEAAGQLLQEALQIMAPLSGSRSYAIALRYLGDLSLDRGDYAAALDAFTRLEQRADALDQADFQSSARRGQGHALSCLERPHEALRAALTAVALAERQGHAYNHIAALRVLAMIHARHALPAPAPMGEPNGALHYLKQALAVAGTVAGYIVPGDLLDALAREYARAGLYQQAYATALEAGAAREQTHSQEAGNRATAMQVHHQTEHARAEGQHHRALAESEARRAAVLQHTSATLERLSAIGQEITTHLEADAVFQVLDRHVHALLPTATFAVYLNAPDGASLVRAHGVEDGRALAPNSIALAHPHAYAARCARERREVYIERIADDGQHVTVVPGTQATLSALYVPLLAGERALGVMTVQALHADAYGERERLIFRTLCAYGAVALDNAHAYRQLQDAQTQLVSQEKLAALGSLMAGVAHELNTPIGNSLLIASTMQQKTEELDTLMGGAGMRRSDLAAYIADSKKASVLVMRGLTSAADLVNSFKQVAVDRTTEQRRLFDLQQVAHEIIATMMNRIRGNGHSLEFDIPPMLVMDSYPGPFGQVVTNLINNALLHAFERGQGGQIWLSAVALANGRVRVTFRDNGAGIAEAHLGRIFDPFFTTKLGQGGSGLGLSISYNIVNALLGGDIGVASGAGGTTFTLELPLKAPRHDPAHPAAIY
ncbi:MULTISPECIES: ATP-binding protein [unclassified Janthinobacterium]|uniref:ATP-binding protein n=1 Tax=unclassified Janthinobacterium TaxID=2610881 RepID=UPI001E2824CC|nr:MULTISPECIES: ATP-binding protein [unclassified Janthinobacterium]MEC5163074.1 signal transduction histidine kinase/tetratricopeptide (TPR) repeat protein [Janthinobacterium sp. CG_S6]